MFQITHDKNRHILISQKEHNNLHYNVQFYTRF